ncbi:MAG: MBOAT family O-acyltransferase [Patescibacteria group bacterium]
MLFNSIAFLFFFPVMVVGFFLFPKRFRWAWLLAGSCYFYASFVPAYLLILFAVIIVNYICGRIMISKPFEKVSQATARSDDRLILETKHTTSSGIARDGASGYFFKKLSSVSKRKWALGIGMASQLGMLFVFKYFNFFQENISAVANLLHWNYSMHALRLLLPLGLSFHTFQGLSYLIEVYKGRTAPEKHFGIFALYIMFFPQLVAGPIERPQHLLPQFHAEQTFSWPRILSGIRLMIWGFFKKVVVADRIAILVNPVYASLSTAPGPTIAITAILFAFQLYGDFSGYSSIAKGCARVFGFELVENFERPYFAKSVAEFWNRWHISLSSWLRDYVYTPLIFSVRRRSRLWIYTCIVITFLVSGVWHGAGWTYIAMGLFFGLAIALGAYTKPWRDRFVSFIRLQKLPWLRRSIQITITFTLACIGWIFFRAPSIKDVGILFGRLFTQWGEVFAHANDAAYIKKFVLMGTTPSVYLTTIGAVIVLLGVDWIQEHHPSLLNPPSRIARVFLATFLLLIVITFGEFYSKTFIYFQF